MEPKLKADVLIVILVKLPKWNGDTTDRKQYEPVREAIFSAKPPGYEVKWAGLKKWPVDADGFTYVPLYPSYENDDINIRHAFWLEELMLMRKKIEQCREFFKTI